MQLRFYICFSVNFNEGANVTMVNSNIGGVSVQVEAPAPKGNLFIFLEHKIQTYLLCLCSMRVIKIWDKCGSNMSKNKNVRVLH